MPLAREESRAPVWLAVRETRGPASALAEGRTRMKVREIMTARPASCSVDTNLPGISAMLWRNDCGIVPVVEPDGRVVGVITDRDICIAVGTRSQRASEISAGDVISRKLHTCFAEDELQNALDTMGAARVRRLPVVDRAGRLVGMLSINDLIVRATPGKTGPISESDVMVALRAISAHEQKVREAHAARA
jgi:CBS domain-containing protein